MRKNLPFRAQPREKPHPGYNALQHGIFATTQIIFDEKAEDLAELAAAYHENHSPAYLKSA